MSCKFEKNALFVPVLLLAAYLPFEDFLLKWLPVSETVFLALRQIPDVVVLGLFLLVAVDDAYRKQKVFTISNKAFLFLLVFVLYGIVAIRINGSSVVTAIMNIKALVRYIGLIYVFLSIRPTERQIRVFLKLILGVAFVEVLIGAAQLFGGEAVLNIFKPFELSSEAGIKFSAMKHDELFGTMSYTTNYASYLLLSIVVLLCFRGALIRGVFLNAFFLTLIVAAIFLSGSRSAFLSALLAILLYVHAMWGIRASAFLTASGVAVLVFATLFLEKGTTNVDFWFFLTPEYLQTLEAQRLGLLRIFMSYASDPHFLFGLSSDKGFVVEYLARKYSLPELFAESTLYSIEDVYWVALAIYYGLIGLLLFIFFLLFLYKKLAALKDASMRSDLQERLFLASKIMMMLLVPLNFVGQAFEVRHLSFYFWALLGMTASQLVASEGQRSKDAHEATAA